jgi:hypothetical protein
MSVLNRCLSLISESCEQRPVYARYGRNNQAPAGGPDRRHLYHVGEWRFISPWGLLP